MTVKYLLAFSILMMSTLQCSAMYYEKKHKVYNPYVTGSLAILSGLSAITLFKATDRALRTQIFVNPTKLLVGCGCSMITIAALHRCSKDAYALYHYDIKRE
jgi:hypothetical protein